MMTIAQRLLIAQARSDASTATQPVATDNRPTGRLSLVGRIRAAAVAVGPSILLDLFAVTSTVAVPTVWIFRPRSRLRRLFCPLAVVGAAVPWVYFLAVRPWHRRWGATDAECRMPLPGDDAVPTPGYHHTRAITIQAPAEEVWPWLAQIGQGRGSFYSYDWLENLAGCDIHSADRVHAEWQDVKAGDPLALARSWGTRLAAIEPGRSLVIEGWGSYTVLPIDARSSRLIARARQPGGWPSLAYLLTIEIPHFIMERRMLLGIKQRAERAVERTGTPFADAESAAEPASRSPIGTVEQAHGAGRQSNAVLSGMDRLALFVESRLDRMLGRLGVGLYRLTRGGIARLVGVNVLVLTTRGRRTGRARTVMLAYFPADQDLVVVAANGGQPSHPGWYFNLRAKPTAHVRVGDRVFSARAEELSATEAAAFWPEVVGTLPGYARYPRATSRAIPLMRLIPLEDGR